MTNQAATQAATTPGLTLAAWIFMVTSVAFVTILVIWCFYKVLKYKEKPAPPVKDFHSA
jgi:hypothetical protein